ncbi:MAG: hypothetical protein LBQ54_06190 [Planctomycetaceae bacterium]|jgi:glycosyltransferase involved in cell wall biosynthesis|nr:hypothetical protein [Planctomycetaceae bacterium]
MQNNHPKIDLKQVREDCYRLDTPDFEIPKEVKLFSHEKFTSVPEIHVNHIPPNGWTRIFRRCRTLFHFFYAIQLCFSTKRNSVLIINGSFGPLWIFVGMIRHLCRFQKRKFLLWDVFVEYKLGKEKRLKFFPFIKIKTEWKETIAGFSLKGFDLAVLWSKKQVPAHAKHFRLPEEMFIFLPYKANHSQWNPYNIEMGRFIFSGGNGKRDYRPLIEAVRGTCIPVIISATDPNVRKQIETLPNVMVLGAPEPAFAQLQAASEFIVVSMIDSGLKGGGEANFCNAMWHGKPVIACCNMAAEDYIIEGETGFIVSVGDAVLLRNRIQMLWNDPVKVRQMGKKAKEHALKFFTHERFVRRLLRLAFVLGDDGVK